MDDTVRNAVDNVLRVRVENVAFGTAMEEVIRVDVVNVPPVMLEKNSVPTTILDACSVILDMAFVDISPTDRVDALIVEA